jgi:multiple sugar transport system permease protein
VSVAPVSGARLDRPAGTAGDPRRARRRRAQWRRRLTVLAFMSPAIVGFGAFIAYPLIATVYFSFTHYDLLEPARWIGLANYKYMFSHDPAIWTAVKNTLWLVAFMVPLKVMFAFGVALMLTRARRGIGVFRAIFYLPALAPPVAATLGFVYLLNPATGPVNAALGVVGIDGPLWFSDPSWSKPALTLLLLWGVGNTMIIFLAALVDVPVHLYESAELDGAGWLQRLRWVTLPTISPVILFAVVIGTIEALQLFTEGYVAASVAAGSASSAADPANDLGYPEDSTLFYPVQLYQQGFRFFNMGYAAAMAVLMLIVTLAITLLIVRNARRWVHYAGGR